VTSDEHSRLIDDIDGRVGKTTAKINNTTKRVTKISEKSSSVALWVIIVILFLSLLGLLIGSFYVSPPAKS
jgi:hypothetical protein